MTRRKHCGECRFYSSHHRSAISGHCRKYPPVLVATAERIYTRWPTVDKLHWCGEFKKKVD